MGGLKVMNTGIHTYKGLRVCTCNGGHMVAWVYRVRWTGILDHMYKCNRLGWHGSKLVIS